MRGAGVECARCGDGRDAVCAANAFSHGGSRRRVLRPRSRARPARISTRALRPRRRRATGDSSSRWCRLATASAAMVRGRVRPKRCPQIRRGPRAKTPPFVPPRTGTRASRPRRQPRACPSRRRSRVTGFSIDHGMLARTATCLDRCRTLILGRLRQGNRNTPQGLSRAELTTAVVGAFLGHAGDQGRARYTARVR